MHTLSFQHEMRPELPNVYGTLDYREFRDMLVKIDKVLRKSDLEHTIVSRALQQFIEKHGLESTSFYNSQKAGFHYKKIKHALRCNIARHLTGESYRLFSIRLADSTLFQWFTGISAFGCRKAISKSTLERYEKCFDETFIGEQIREWLAGLSDNAKATDVGLSQPLDLTQTFTDSTCVKAHIHFPVDWVLLRDAARSLLRAINTIRAQGLKQRMVEPQQLLKQTNGIIIDWELFAEQPPSDSRLMDSIINRLEKYYGQIHSACADRGFANQTNVALLKEKNIINAICPKSPKELQEKLTDPVFVSFQTRRSQTEARIGIFKNMFLGKPLRSRITTNKRHAINWCVLTHNLWVIARMALADEQSLLKKAA